MFVMKVLSAAVLALAVTPSAGADALTRQADAVVRAAYPAGRPGAAVVITRRGRVVYASASGLADVRTGRRLRSTDVFRLGSITKQFTASVILQLVDEGKVSLDDPVSRFLPDYPQPGASATVRQLLNHTSGIASYNDIPGWMVEANTDRSYTTPQLIAVFQDLPAKSSPGKAWSYSNSGYVLLGAVIESVTGKPWCEEVSSRLARPLGLATIGCGSVQGSNAATVEGYTAAADGAVQPARRTHGSVTHAAAGLVGSATDLAKWTHALHGGRMVGPALYSQMTTPTALPGGRSQPYGFGLALGEVRGRSVIRHDGRIAGFSNESIHLPAEDVAVVVLTNSDSPTTSPTLVGRRLAALALGEPYRLFSRAKVDVQALAPLFGVYRVGEKGAARRFSERGGKLYITREGAPEREVLAAGRDEFFYPDSFTWFSVERRPGALPVMHFHQDGAPDAERAERIRASPQSAPGANVAR